MLLLTLEQPVLLSPKSSIAVANFIGKVCATSRTSCCRSPLAQEKFKSERPPITEAKSIKNDAEIAGFRASHIRDGAALVRAIQFITTKLNSPVFSRSAISPGSTRNWLLVPVSLRAKAQTNLSTSARSWSCSKA